MDGSSYLSAGFLDIEEILDLQLVNHTSDEFKVTDYSWLRYNPQGDRWSKNYKVDQAKEIKDGNIWININFDTSRYHSESCMKTTLVQEIARFLGVFGINTASDISKFTKISRAAAASDIWGVLKYHEPVYIPNTPKKPCYFLFILQGKEISHFI